MFFFSGHTLIFINPENYKNKSEKENVPIDIIVAGEYSRSRRPNNPKIYNMYRFNLDPDMISTEESIEKNSDCSDSCEGDDEMEILYELEYDVLLNGNREKTLSQLSDALDRFFSDAWMIASDFDVVPVQMN